MTQGLERWYGGHDLHFITCSSYHRGPELKSVQRRDLFLRVLEQARSRYRFVVIGYVVMPEHFHLLMTEPEVGNPSVVMKVSDRCNGVGPTSTILSAGGRLGVQDEVGRG
jgi:REP element-mobilizing transposase RayT